MKQSNLFAKTTKTVSSDIKMTSHKLLHQAGFIRESTAGRYYFLPLGIRVRDKIVKIIEKEMNKAGALKMITPVLHPLDLWKETNRDKTVGFELMEIKDRNNSDFALGGTAEEMMVALVRDFNISYKDLPFNIYQFSQKFRDELRARGGLLRVREFLMKDAYSFHANEKDFKREYEVMGNTYSNIFKKVGLNTIKVESDNGYIAGDYCHEYVVENDIGESKFLVNEDSSYCAHEEVAVFKKDNKNADEEEKKITLVSVNRGNTMKAGVDFHNKPLWQQIKNVMYVNDKNEMILAVIRGDLGVNEVKLKKLSQANSLRHANEKEIREMGSEPGFISPIKINKKVIIVADDSLRTIKNGCSGANKKNKDYININIDRDFSPNIEGDIAMAKDGFFSKDDKVLKEKKGIEVGNIFQLGYYYSEKMKANFTDKDGKEKNYYMGCYGIGVGRTMATIIEEHHDEAGMIWPKEVSPFDVHLVLLNSDDKGVNKVSDELYGTLQKNNIEVLYDDRQDKSPGEKLADSDLIGIPQRIVVSKKTVEKGKFEYKLRNEKDFSLLDEKELINLIKDNK
ncbi:MAG: proline--tRNA ligase [Parcubacteria group bacterium]|nr:proline--tRNA ligase [Parcubacteria group bacterium]